MVYYFYMCFKFMYSHSKNYAGIIWYSFACKVVCLILMLFKQIYYQYFVL